MALEIVIPVAIVVILVGMAFFKHHLYICQPNEILIFSGRGRAKDGEPAGYRVLKGGRRLRLPFIESVTRMSLETTPIEIELRGALAKGIIPLNVKGIANIKIAGNEADGLYNAIERFPGKSKDRVARVARETLEGSLRGVLATLTPEEANRQRLDFGRQVMQEAAADFKRLGLVIDTFKIQDISDEERYLEAIGKKKNAEVQRDARIAEARAEAEARKVAAEARQEAKIAEAKAQEAVVEAENELRVRTADLGSVSARAESRAEMAGKIARTEEEAELEQRRATKSEHRQRADVIIPAEAEKQAAALRAQGKAAQISENGRATAEAVQLMRQEWEQGEARELFLIQLMPHIVDKITRVVADNLSIDKLTIVDGGGEGDGLPRYMRGLAGSMTSVFEEVKNATGLDIPDLMQTRNGGGQAPRLIKKELDG